MWWPFKRNRIPDIEQFNRTLMRSVVGRMYTELDVARDFRSLFNREPQQGQRVLFTILKWCGEYEAPPDDPEELKRWAGKREIAQLIKTVMYADLASEEEETKYDDPRLND